MKGPQLRRAAKPAESRGTLTETRAGSQDTTQKLVAVKATGAPAVEPAVAKTTTPNGMNDVARWNKLSDEALASVCKVIIILFLRIDIRLSYYESALNACQ